MELIPKPLNKFKERYWRGRLLPHFLYWDTKNRAFCLKVWDKETQSQKHISYHTSFDEAVTAVFLWERQHFGEASIRTMQIIKRYNVKLYVNGDLFNNVRTQLASGS